MTSLQRNYGDDGRSEVILDAAGNIYVASTTQSIDFPVSASAFQTASGGLQDGVLLKLTPNVGTLTFASYLGGSANDAAYVLSLDPAGNIYVAGGTESSNLPGNTAGTIGTSNHGIIDGFISVINNSGTSILRTTYIGTSAIDQILEFSLTGWGFLISWDKLLATGLYKMPCIIIQQESNSLLSYNQIYRLMFILQLLVLVHPLLIFHR